MIFVNQKIGLSTTFTESGVVIDISGGTVTYEYYYPGDSSSTPSGTISGSVVSGPDGTATGEITAEINNTVGENFRVQAVVIVSGDTYRAQTTCFQIYPLGAGC